LTVIGGDYTPLHEPETLARVPSKDDQPNLQVARFAGFAGQTKKGNPKTPWMG